MVAQESVRKGDKRTLIRDAAVQVFAEKGFHNARVSDVAERAGVADGTIYLYYRNKEDLLLSIFEDAMETLREGLLERLGAVNDPLEGVRVFAQFHFEQVRDHRAVAEVLHVHLRGSNKFFKDYRPEKLWAYLKVFADLVTRGQEMGVIREDVNPFIQMWCFFGALDELGMQWVLSRKKKFDLEPAAEQVAELFIRGMAKSPTPEEAS